MNEVDTWTTLLAGNKFATSSSAEAAADEALEAFPTSLVILELQKNQLTAMPRAIATLVSLQKLDFSDNLLSTVPARLATMPKLNHLDLRNNRPLKSVPYEIAQFKNRMGVWASWWGGSVPKLNSFDSHGLERRLLSKIGKKLDF